ncbi:MAG TPA: cytochrome c biogenesis protein CcsA [Verrucomicrobiota bacterium]|nr:cytochrome c biogenesis protein CcsA [Verrucomicrobiota bacterium]
MKKWLPWILVVVMAAWVVSTLRSNTKSELNTDDFGRLPVLLNGRIQPFDSVARNSLLQIRARQTVHGELDSGPYKMSATEWLLEVMTDPEKADDRKIFRIDNLEVQGLLELPDGQKYYSFNQIKPKFDALTHEAQRVQKIESAQRTVFEAQVMKLYNVATLYQRLRISLKPPQSEDPAAELAAHQEAITPGIAAVRARQAGQEFDVQSLEKVLAFMNEYDVVSRFALPLIIPPATPGASDEDWQNMGSGALASLKSGTIAEPVLFYGAMASAYRNADAQAFNRAVADYRDWLGASYQAQLKKGREEFFFSRLEPFYKATVIYVLAFVLVCVSWFTGSELLRRCGFHLVVFGFIIHTIGLVFRMYLEARPPVTNLYSSAIFIGWGAAALGLVLEKIYKDGIGCVVAAFVGFVTQIIAHNLALGGDTMEMMRAVLDTNFWLATHVITITLGYSAMFVAGFLAILYIIRGVFSRTLNEASSKALARMVYGIVCFAMFFSFIGTVLGGIWADQSWGRFWGWDPKENGALLIVIWVAIILHARWGGLIKERGLMNLAIFGNVVTAFSWFGVNMLGIGLHSYGFMDAAFKWLMLFTASQICLILLGSLPLAMWKSFQQPVATNDPVRSRP